MQEKRIGVEIRAVGNRIRRYMDSTSVKNDIDTLTGMHGYIIGYLAHHGEERVYQRDIEQVFSVRRSTASLILQRMERNGLIVRESVAEDARLKCIRLTKKAWALHLRVEEEHTALESCMKRGLTALELSTFFTVMEKIQKNLDRGTER